MCFLLIPATKFGLFLQPLQYPNEEGLGMPGAQYRTPTKHQSQMLKSKLKHSKRGTKMNPRNKYLWIVI